MATNFTPMFYILGVVSLADLPKLPSLNTFDSLYYLLSPTCCFIPSFGKSPCDKLKYSLRKFSNRLEIEEIEKKKKEKVI